MKTALAAPPRVYRTKRTSTMTIVRLANDECVRRAARVSSVCVLCVYACLYEKSTELLSRCGTAVELRL